VETEAHPNEPILGAGRKELAIRGETNGADVEISLLGNVVVVERAAERAGAHIEYLGGAVAPSREPHTVLAKADTTHDALVVELVHEADVERLGYARVVEREPVLAVLSVLGGHRGRIEVAREFLLGAYDGRRRSGCRLRWEVAAASGGRLVYRRGWRWWWGRRGPIVVVCCWQTTPDAAAWRVLLLMLGTLRMGHVQFTIIPAVVLARVRWLLHRHGLQSAAAPSWRWSNGSIWTLAHRNRGECDTAHPER